MEKNAELVFIPSPGIGHLIPFVELAKKLIDLSHRLTISIVLIKVSSDNKVVTSYIQSLQSDSSIDKTRIKILDDIPQPTCNTTDRRVLLEYYKPIIRDAMAERLIKNESNSDSRRLAGFVVDMFCSTMIEVATDLGLPAYVFFVSGANLLSLMMYSLSLLDHQGEAVIEEFSKPDTEFNVPGLKNPIPSKVIPYMMQDRESCLNFLNHARRFRQTKGILINSFTELESGAIKALDIEDDNMIPRVYPVGPVITLNRSSNNGEGSTTEAEDQKDSLSEWLDSQPSSSVVFLCFGSLGGFKDDQVKEIAIGLEKSGHRFLWSVRRPGKIGELAPPSDYEPDELSEILPNGFSKRTAEIGKVIGWAPQVEILAHPSIGAFVSHCGWNSTLESLWFGVPVATWPSSAEQQLNAFQLVKESGLAVEIRMDYRWDKRAKTSNFNVKAQEIEKGVKKVMEDQGVKMKVKEMKEKSRLALTESGSSCCSIEKFMKDVFSNMS